MIYPKLTLCGSKKKCARTDTVFFPISQVHTKGVTLRKSMAYGEHMFSLVLEKTQHGPVQGNVIFFYQILRFCLPLSFCPGCWDICCVTNLPLELDQIEWPCWNQPKNVLLAVTYIYSINILNILLYKLYNWIIGHFFT